MTSTGLPRWAVSFADLVLLLLAFTVMVNMTIARGADPAAVRAGTPARAALLDGPAATLFDPGEARLTVRARAKINEVGRAAADRGQSLVVESIGADSGAARFDRWELAAARAAAVSRALAEAGLPEDRVDISLLSAPTKAGRPGQRITIRGS